MRRVPFHCSNHHKEYEQYYRNQVGGNFSEYYQGQAYQKGYGIGGILSSLFKSALPIIKSGAKSLGKNALNAGLGLAVDAIQGQDMKTAAKNRLREAGMNTIQEFASSTSPIKHPVTQQRPSKRRKTKQGGRPTDVFDQ